MWYVHYYGQLTHLTVTADDNGVSDIIKWMEHHENTNVYVMGRGVTLIRE